MLSSMHMHQLLRLALHPHLLQAARAVASAPASRSSLALIKELREKSGAPISDVKACLEKAEWDLDVAYDLLRKRGLAAAAKKASRLAAEGLLGVVTQPGLAAVVEINSETDFVPRNQLFKDLVTSACRAAAQLPATAVGPNHEVDISILQKAVVPDTRTTVQDMCASVAAQVRENVQLRRAFLLTSPGVVGSYVHNIADKGLGSIVSIVTLEQSDQQQLSVSGSGREQVAKLANDLAMHAVGRSAQYIDPLSVPQDLVQKERKLLAEQAQASGKPAKFVEKMVEGRLGKFYEEICLLEQKFLLDDNVKVSALLKKVSADLKLQPPLKVGQMLRVQCGEGLRDAAATGKSFADEVASIVQG